MRSWRGISWGLFLRILLLLEWVCACEGGGGG